MLCSVGYSLGFLFPFSPWGLSKMLKIKNVVPFVPAYIKDGVLLVPRRAGRGQEEANTLYMVVQTAPGIFKIINLSEGNRWSDTEYFRGDLIPDSYSVVQSAEVEFYTPSGNCK